MKDREFATKFHQQIVKVLGARVVGPALGALYRQNVQQEFEGVLCLKCLLDRDLTQKVNASVLDK